MTNPDLPQGGFLPIPKGAVSYCSGPSGDCLWLRPALTLREDPAGEPVVPGEVPSLEMGDTGGSFKVKVRPHEIEKLAEPWLRRVYAEYGMAGIRAIVADVAAQAAGTEPEVLDEHVYDLIEKDIAASDKKLGRPGWRQYAAQLTEEAAY
jgi:hypothetical protein